MLTKTRTKLQIYFNLSAIKWYSIHPDLSSAVVAMDFESGSFSIYVPGEQEKFQLLKIDTSKTTSQS